MYIEDSCLSLPSCHLALLRAITAKCNDSERLCMLELSLLRIRASNAQPQKGIFPQDIQRTAHQKHFFCQAFDLTRRPSFFGFSFFNFRFARNFCFFLVFLFSLLAIATKIVSRQNSFGLRFLLGGWIGV